MPPMAHMYILAVRVPRRHFSSQRASMRKCLIVEPVSFSTTHATKHSSIQTLDSTIGVPNLNDGSSTKYLTRRRGQDHCNHRGRQNPVSGIEASITYASRIIRKILKKLDVTSTVPVPFKPMSASSIAPSNSSLRNAAASNVTAQSIATTTFLSTPYLQKYRRTYCSFP